MKQYVLVALGGTFDHLHKGHEYFITQAALLGQTLLIGLTSDKFVRQKFQISNFKFQIQEWGIRKKAIEDFLKKNGLLHRSQIVKIDDVYGPTLVRDDIEAIVVTPESRKGAETINTTRREKGLLPIPLVEIPLIVADDRKAISSTRIRLGEIDRFGTLYGNLPIFGSAISEPFRRFLKHPIGVLIPGDSNHPLALLEKVEKQCMHYAPHPFIVTVGDEVTRLMLPSHGLSIACAVVDLHINRRRRFAGISEIGFADPFRLHEAKNPPGYITHALARAVQQAFREATTSSKLQVIHVDGEEDLAGVPAMLFAPLGSLILYGQPGEGVVVVEVTEEKKQELVERMKQ